MTNTIELIDVEPQVIAAVKARITMADIPEKIMPLMDKVWAFIRGQGIEGHGHNVWLYRDAGDGELDVEIGVQVSTPFTAGGDVVAAQLPTGKAAHTFHYGEYDALPRMHNALVNWCQEHGHPIDDVCWEIYGDWHDDPAKRRTDVYRLIAPQT